MSTAPRLSLFASLRRDRFLFAFVGALVLLLNALQPLAASQMPEGGHLAICTTLGLDTQAASSGDLPAGPLDDCPICLIGNACGGMAGYKAVPASFAAFPAPAALPPPRRPPRRPLRRLRHEPRRAARRAAPGNPRTPAFSLRNSCPLTRATF